MPITLNFIGDITIDSIKPRNDDGSLGGHTFSAVDATKNQLIEGKSTLYNALISITVYSEGNLPVFTMLRTEMEAAVLPRVPPRYDRDVVTPIEHPDLGINPVSWSALIPAGTLAAGTDYVVIARDNEDMASTSQSIHTA